MSKKETGGPAFPQLAKCGDMAVADGGMTLRDYFAAKALSGILGDIDLHQKPLRAASTAYALADAMLKERAK